MLRRLERLRLQQANPSLRAIDQEMCRRSCRHFFDEWVWTYDPRVAGSAAWRPMDLFPRQVELIEFLDARLAAKEDGLVEKSRDVGFNWVVGGWAVHKWLYVPGFKTTFGSYVQNKVDLIGDLDSIFEKIRMLLRRLPPWFLPPGFSWVAHSNFMRLVNPANGNTITGESGDNMGRGGRSSVYVIDEAAHLQHAELAEAATAANSDVRIWGSSVSGMDNLFAQKRHGGQLRDDQIFTFHWSDDPRKSRAWAEAKKASMPSHIWAAEYDIDYAASVGGVLIPAEWARSALDAHVVLNLKPAGAKAAALDVADEGMDFNAFVGAYGFLVQDVEQFSGKGSDIMATVEKTFAKCDERGYASFRYDSDGLGAGVRGDARTVAEARKRAGRTLITVEPFRGSEAPVDPLKPVDLGGGPSVEKGARTNEDFFANRKAQGWWALRLRFQRTHRWVTEGVRCAPDDIVSISSQATDARQLITEVSQPTYRFNASGRMLVDKAPDGMRSPNRADALMIRYAPAARAPFRVTPQLLARI